jgi:thioredoxin-like negative regulator of GroEL
VGIDNTSSAGTRLVKRYGITTLPTLLFLSPQNQREEALIGFIPPSNLLAELQRIQTGTGTVSDFQKRVAANPDDLQLQHNLALKLRDVGDQAAHDSIIPAIRQQDPRGKTVVGARLLF